MVYKDIHNSVNLLTVPQRLQGMTMHLRLCVSLSHHLMHSCSHTHIHLALFPGLHPSFCRLQYEKRGDGLEGLRGDGLEGLRGDGLEGLRGDGLEGFRTWCETLPGHLRAFRTASDKSWGGGLGTRLHTPTPTLTNIRTHTHTHTHTRMLTHKQK